MRKCNSYSEIEGLSEEMLPVFRRSNGFATRKPDMRMFEDDIESGLCHTETVKYVKPSKSCSEFDTCRVNNPQIQNTRSKTIDINRIERDDFEFRMSLHANNPYIDKSSSSSSPDFPDFEESGKFEDFQRMHAKHQKQT